jgi:hypothetical protein
MKTHLTLVPMLAFVATAILGAATASGAGPGPAPAPTYETSYAQEASYSCLSGGCHENNAALVDGYSKSYMTHVMVKCNACHGTHTAAEVGGPKPHLTGYLAGMGATGYVVGKDRCIACHSAIAYQAKHPNNPSECISCHAPHAFTK